MKIFTFSKYFFSFINRYSFTLICFLLFGMSVSAQQISGDQITAGASLSTDVNPDVTAANSKINDLKSFIKVFVDPLQYNNQSYRATLVMNITPQLLGGGLGTPYQKTFIVEYNTNGQVGVYNDLMQEQIKNASGLTLDIISVTLIDPNSNTPVNIIPESLSIEVGTKLVNQRLLAEEVPQIRLSSSSSNVLNISWDEIAGAVSYEVEWTWVDNYWKANDGTSDITAVKPANIIEFTNRDFELNNTRVLVDHTFYDIPLLYSRGYLLYRVRAIGLFYPNSDKSFYGDWSGGDIPKQHVSDWDFITVTPHENNKNWQFQASYAEEGKKKEVISYFDGTLRNRQTVTTINSDHNPIVGEVIYDAQGRPAIEVLPVPVSSTLNRGLKYYANFNTPSSNSTVPYTFYNFDWDPANQDNCATDTEGMSNYSGASRYYSSNTDVNESKPHQAYVPDAKNFPFSQIEYTSDNTGRIARKGGVGDTHQLGKGHEMKYYYLQPSQEELNRLFGYNVGDKKRYKKNMVVDPNGQVSISYIDPQGRTIATALSGLSPDQMQALEDEGKVTDDLIFDLLNKKNITDTKQPQDNNEYISTGRFGNSVNDGLTVSYPLGVSEANSIFDFTYAMYTQNAYSEDCLQGDYEFKYDLVLQLEDDCGTDLLAEGGLEQEEISSFEEKTLVTKSLNVGSYTLNKRIVVNKNALNTYTEQYIDDYLCLLNLEDFTPVIDRDDCFSSCQECVNSILGKPDTYDQLYPSESELILPRQQYVIEQITQTMGNDTFSYSGSVLTFILPEDINDPADITLYESKVDLYENRFKEEFNLLLEACQSSCSPISVCEVNELTLLADVSPSGQYGDTGDNANDTDEVTGALDALSFFNENNEFGIEKSWKNPAIPYQDELGEIAKVYITENSTYEYMGELRIDPATDLEYILPEQLVNIEDFLSLWKSSWANSLVSYHPEYCYLQYYEQLCNGYIDIGVGFELNSDSYDEFVLNKINTIAEALGRGDFSNPDLLESETSLYDNDPYFRQSYSGNVDRTIAGQNTLQVRRNIMLEALQSNYSKIVNAEGVEVQVTMLQMAYITVFYGNDLSGDVTDSDNLPSNNEIISLLLRLKLTN